MQTRRSDSAQPMPVDNATVGVGLPWLRPSADHAAAGGRVLRVGRRCPGRRSAGHDRRLGRPDVGGVGGDLPGRPGRAAHRSQPEPLPGHRALRVAGREAGRVSQRPHRTAGPLRGRQRRPRPDSHLTCPPAGAGAAAERLAAGQPALPRRHDEPAGPQRDADHGALGVREGTRAAGSRAHGGTRCHRRADTVSRRAGCCVSREHGCASRDHDRAAGVQQFLAAVGRRPPRLVGSEPARRGRRSTVSASSTRVADGSRASRPRPSPGRRTATGSPTCAAECWRCARAPAPAASFSGSGCSRRARSGRS